MVTPKVTSNATFKNTHSESSNVKNSAMTVTEKAISGITVSGEVSLKSLFRSRKQREILELLFDEARRTGSRVIKTTNTEIAKRLGTIPRNVKGPVKRLFESGCLIQREMKRGQTGGQTIEIPEPIYMALELEFRADPSLVLGPQRLHGRLHERLQTAPSSSSSFENSKTTSNYDLPVTLKDNVIFQMDIEAIGLNKFQMNQVAQLIAIGKVEEDLVQYTASEVAFHIENGGTFTKSAERAFFNGLRTGHGFRSPIREEVEKKMREELERRMADAKRLRELDQ